MASTVQVGKYRVQRYRILGTSCFVFVAYEPADGYAGQGGYDHSMLFRMPEGEMWGTVTSRRFPPEFAKLPPGSEERARVARSYHVGLDALARVVIEQAFPELLTRPGVVWSSGEASAFVPDPEEFNRWEAEDRAAQEVA